MGYYSDVRICTTPKGLEKIKELAPKYYDELLRKDGKVVEENDDTITISENGISTVYTKDLWRLNSLKTYAVSRDDNYVMVGWDGIKWMGYNYKDIKAFEKAFENCGEPVRYVAIGEDNATDEGQWGDESYDMPYLEVSCCFDYDGEWDLRAEAI